MEGSYYKEYYETGAPKAEGWVKNGIKTGYWKFYHENGKRSEQGHYRNNLREEYWYFYTENGILEKEGHYYKGKKSNWWLFYDINMAILPLPLNITKAKNLRIGMISEVLKKKIGLPI